jgi:hypothetical protein
MGPMRICTSWVRRHRPSSGSMMKLTRRRKKRISALSGTNSIKWPGSTFV